MIQVSLVQIVNAQDTLQKISGNTFKGSTVFKIARLLRALDKEMETFNQSRDQIIRTYGETDENGELAISENNMVKIKPDCIQTANNEIQQLLETEVEIVADKLPLSCLEEVELTPNDFLKIEPFFEDDLA